MWLRLWTRGALVALTLGMGAAEASTVLYRDVPALARGSDAIVIGQVVRAQSRWTADRRRIVTDIEIRVDETLKGEGRATLLVRQPGGVVGDVGQRVDGLAGFEVGEEVVLFLERRPDDSFLIAGLSQGKFQVVRSSDGKGVYAVPDPAVKAARVLDPDTLQERTVTPRTWALDELRAEVRRALQTPAPVEPEPADPVLQKTPSPGPAPVNGEAK